MHKLRPYIQCPNSANALQPHFICSTHMRRDAQTAKHLSKLHHNRERNVATRTVSINRWSQKIYDAMLKSQHERYPLTCMVEHTSHKGSYLSPAPRFPPLCSANPYVWHVWTKNHIKNNAPHFRLRLCDHLKIAIVIVITRITTILIRILVITIVE